jgi:hypothetical protein
MSFADPRSPGRPGPRTDAPSPTAAGRNPDAAGEFRRRLSRSDDDEPLVERPRGKSFTRTVDWEHVGLLGAGLVIGAVLGAGAALLLAPQSGFETRVAIGRRARGARHRARDAWDDFADDLAAVTRRGRRRARRVITRARWRASDAVS